MTRTSDIMRGAASAISKSYATTDHCILHRHNHCMRSCQLLPLVNPKPSVIVIIGFDASCLDGQKEKIFSPFATLIFGGKPPPPFFFV